MVNSSSKTEGNLSSLDLTLYKPLLITHSFAKWTHQHKHIPQDHHIGLPAEKHIKDLLSKKFHRNNYMDASSFSSSYVKSFNSCYQPSKIPVLYVDSLGILLWKTTDCLCWNCCFLLFFWSQRHSSIILKVVRKVLLHRA